MMGMKNFWRGTWKDAWKDAELLSTDTNPAILKVKVRQSRSFQKRHFVFCGVWACGIIFRLKKENANIIDVAPLALLALLSVVSIFLYKRRIRELQLMIRQQEEEQGDT